MSEIYLADGVYASFDGYQFCLRAPRESGDHKIYLDAEVMRAFDQFRKRVVANSAAHSQVEQ